MPSWATSMRQLASPISVAMASISAGLLSTGRRSRSAISPWIVSLRQAPVGLGGEHDPPGQLGLGDRPAAMRADLDHQDIADRQLETMPMSVMVIPVVSASVSSVRLPTPSAARPRAGGAALVIAHDRVVKPKWIGSRIGSARNGRPARSSRSQAWLRPSSSPWRAGISTGTASVSKARSSVSSFRLSRKSAPARAPRRSSA